MVCININVTIINTIVRITRRRFESQSLLQSEFPVLEFVKIRCKKILTNQKKKKKKKKKKNKKKKIKKKKKKKK